MSGQAGFLTLALYQGPGRMADMAGVIALIASQAQIARAQGADILLLPEMFLSGYNIGAECARALAQMPYGEVIDRVAGIARDHAIALCFGYPELVGDQVANAAMLIGPDGRILLNYRKTHLFGTLDRDMFACEGEGYPTVSFNGFTIGLLICYDIEFPEPARLLAVQNADLILVPTSLMPPYDIVADRIIPVRAYENQLYVAYCNRSGAENDLPYIGKSHICGPGGATLAQAGRGEEMLIASLSRAQIDEVRARDSMMRDRRPALYQGLVS
jgi:predicted amidohydrolase